MQACLSPGELSELLNNDLVEAVRRDRESHLGDCPNCQQVLLELSGHTTLSGRRAMLRPAATDTIEPPADFLRRLKTMPARPLRDAPQSWPAITGYSIVGELGHGGMAVVYKAVQHGLNRPVALKMILAGKHASSALRNRFRAEAEAVARLQHPNIVQIHEIGEHDGLPYFSMELVEGGTLSKSLAMGRWAGGGKERCLQAARLVETLARAIHHAHHQGVVHRDLKPANILLASGGRESPEPATSEDSRPPLALVFPKIADFGLALYQDEGPNQTRTGEVMGTPNYMAPEQAQGRRGDVGPATDVHALGAILYELLSGRPPYLAATGVETLMQVSFEEPVSPRRLRHDLPQDLETICLKCLRKLPRQRYGSAFELAEDLRRFIEGMPIKARPVTALERAVKWARRRPLSASLLAGLVVVTLVGFAAVTFALVKTREAQQKEAHHRQAAEEALDRSERSVYFGNIAQARSQWLLNNIGASARLLDQCPPKLRGWEWHYLHGLNHTDLLTISDTVHPYITGLSFDLSGRWFVSGGGSPFPERQKGIVQVHDVDTGELRWRKEDLRYFVRAVAWSADGKLVASAGGNWFPSEPGELKVWNATTGELLHDLAGHEKDVVGVAFHPRGGLLASASTDKTVRVWNLETHREVLRLEHNAQAHTVTYSPDNRWLISGGDDGVRVWDGGTGKPVAHFARLGSLVALSPDGRSIASDHAGGARIWDFSQIQAGLANPPASLPLLQSFSAHGGGVTGLAFSPDGALLATTSVDGTVRTWDVMNGDEQAIYRGHEGRVSALAFHPHGRVLLSGGEQPGDIKFWDLTRPVEHAAPVSFADQRRDIDALAFSADDRELLAIGKGGLLRRWDSATGLVARESGHGCSSEWLVPARPAVFSGNGELLAAVVGGEPAQVKIVKTDDGQELRRLRGHTVKIWHVACDHAGSRVATAAFGQKDGRYLRELKVWDIVSGRLLRDDASHDERCECLIMSADGFRLAESRGRVKGSEKPGLPAVFLSEATGDAEPLRLPVSEYSVRALALRADGQLLAAGNDAGEVTVWENGTRTIHDRPLQGSPGLSALEFSPDGQRLAGANRERMQLWDVASGQDILFLLGSPPRPFDVGFNPVLAWSHDGTRLAASNWNRVVSLWDTAATDQLQTKKILSVHANNRAADWHLGRAEAAAAGNAFAFAFHRSRLEALDLPIPALRHTRADFLVRCGRRDRALADIARDFHGAAPTDLRGLFEYALLRVEAGDLAAYEKLRDELLAKHAATAKGLALTNLVRAAGLTPLPDALAARYLEAAQRHFQATPRQRAAQDYWSLAHYRSGKWQEAAEHAQQLLDSGEKDKASPLAWVMLALIQQQQGNKEAASPWLAKVDAWLDAQAKLMPPAVTLAADDFDWQSVLEIRLLRREVDALRKRTQ